VGSIRERPAGSGRWELRVALGRDPATGRYRQLSRTVYGTEAEARAALTDLELATRRRSGPEHGSTAGYRSGCRCRACRVAKSRDNRRRYRRQRHAERLALAGRRFPLSPIEAALRAASVSELARRLDVDRTMVYRWRRSGLTWRRADDLACRADRHPSELWAEWAA